MHILGYSDFGFSSKQDALLLDSIRPVLLLLFEYTLSPVLENVASHDPNVIILVGSGSCMAMLK